MGDATLHRHDDTIPGPDGPPIVPFPRKHLALSAPGGALVLSPLETPLRMRGSGSGERSRGCPLCDPTNAMPANAGTHSGHLGTFSAAGRRLLIFVGSAWRPLLRMGELTQMCQLIPDIFSFPPCTAQKVNCPEGARDAPLEGFLFDVSKRKWGGCVPAAVRRVPLRSKENVRNIPMGKAHLGLQFRMVSPCSPAPQSGAVPSQFLNQFIVNQKEQLSWQSI